MNEYPAVDGWIDAARNLLPLIVNIRTKFAPGAGCLNFVSRAIREKTKPRIIRGTPSYSEWDHFNDARRLFCSPMLKILGSGKRDICGS